ncbi:MAG TPA: prepilin-type N-terminal cleavage/methylation domain-containing protein [Thermoanaerobaculia bacterium]|jgi:prepilin-type N-terminal cleavage/methylation domain-containing protein|nr:prepilin-type N-terminal cleavage/methylation domain-containing protein [Thermoanaerobaculia bacterium]
MKHRRSIPRTQRGFTLVEILVTTAIFAIIMIAALSVYDQSNKVFKTSTEQADMQQSTRIGFDKLVSDVRMAGFDYSRGGTPVTAGTFAQPDEQIEYAGPTAIAFRANFNYTSASAQGNGLEPTYTPYDPATKGAIFPYVTTSNDEIVVYALKSADTTKNTSTIKFYADTDIPRSGYPGSPSAGKEKLVTVSGIDTTNANPPYTLYRITVSDLLATPPRAGTPVAENIRALHFFYYTDPKGTTILKDPASQSTPQADITTGRDAGGTTFSTTYSVTLPDGSTATYNTGAIGGDGQYDANNSATANVDDRNMRATIQAIKVDLTGMNANPDSKYTNATETIAAIKSYRQYQLSALIVPRNLGLTGFPEPSYTPPGPPTITGVCVSACAVPVVCWSAPTTGGPVLQYRLEWDTSTGGSFSNGVNITDMNISSYVVGDDGVMDPSLTWYYRMTAQNDNGSSVPSDLVAISPKNMTRPLPPSGLKATTATAPAATTPGNVDYAIGLTWNSPTKNDPAKSGSNCTGGGCATDGSTIPPQEVIRYKVIRGLTPTFDPTKGEGVTVLDISTKSQPAVVAPGSTVLWRDTAAGSNSIFPPGTCVPYYYRVLAQDRCAANPNYNASGQTNDSVSDWAPVVGNLAQVSGQAYDAGPGVQASAPATVSFGASSACPAIGTCTIYLNWSQVGTDNAGNAIGVDKYRIQRFKKIITDPDYTADTTFGTGGYVDQSGQSQINSGILAYTDSAAAADSNGQPLYYKYIVTANDCRLGIDSAPAYYPPLCSVNPVIVQVGAQSNTSTGDSPSQAYVFNSGDTITVTPPVSGGITISKVKFTVYNYPSLTLVDDYPVITTAPFRYAWSDRSDLSVYYVKIEVTSSSGCTETHVKYVQDQQAASCSFQSQTAPVPTESTSGATVTATTASPQFTITNGASDTMTMNGQSYSLTFADPDGNHSDIKLISVQFSTVVAGVTNTWTDTLTTPATPGTVTRFFPNASPVLTTASAGTLKVTIKWQYAKKDSSGKDRSPISISPLTKFCIGYTIPSEAGVAKKCNAVGRAVTTANPVSCD